MSSSLLLRKFIFLFYSASIIIGSINSIRSDQVGPNIIATGEGSEGNWKTLVYCPMESFVKGYRMRVDNAWSYDVTAMNSAEMECFDYKGNSQRTINSHGGFWGDWYSYIYCPDNFVGYANFMNAYNMLQGSVVTGSLSMKGRCLSSDEIQAGGTNTAESGTWGGWGVCPEGTAICGFQSKVEDEQGFQNDSALNHILIVCCRLCDPSGGLYLSGNRCEQCHYTCKTCSGPNLNDCNSCIFTTTHIHTLSSGTCLFPSFEYIKANEAPPSTWTSSPSSATSTCGYFGNILGGYNIFGSGAFSKFTYTNIPPFFRVRVWLRFLKIDSWENELFYVHVNSALKFTSSTFGSKDNIYTGSQCGAGDNELSRIISFEYADNTSNSLEIKFSSSIDEISSNESWGISFVVLSVLKCHVTCNTCTDENFNSCLSCYNHATKQADNSCVCDETYYAVSASPCTSSTCTVCNPCSTGCRTCIGISDCLCCISGFYLSGEGICKLCHTSCETCSGGTNTNCRTCSISSGRFHDKPTADIDGMCLLTCLSPYDYAHEPTRRCQSKCPAPTWGVLSTKSCENFCPSDNYCKMEDIAQRVCVVCHSNCATCVGPLSTDCHSCTGSLYLYGKECLADCGQGKYGKSSTNTCENCDPASLCKSCETPDQPTKCLSCDVPYYLKNSRCVRSCSTDEFIDFVSRKCEACHLSCATCLSGSSRYCLSCSGSLNFYEVDNTCISSCPNPYFATSNLCIKTCPPPLFGQSLTRTCDSICLNDEYADPSDRICRKCHSDCLTCKGIKNTDCLTCDIPRYKKVSACVLDCGPGYYGKKLNSQNTCEACTSNCLTCVTPDGASRCLSCGIILGVTYFLSGTSCITSCSNPLWGNLISFTCESSCKSNQYGDPVDRICKDCPSHCITCDHRGCIDCPSNLNFYQNDCVSCSEGFWGDPLNSGEFRCINCLEKVEYVFTQNECAKTLSYYLDVNSGKCVSICPSETYGNSFTKICEYCDPNCKSCKTPNQPKTCQSCECPFFLMTNKCVVEEECLPGNFIVSEPRLCLPCNSNCFTCKLKAEFCTTCTEGKYIDPADNKCKICYSTCKTCSEKQNTNCLSCSGPKFHSGGSGDGECITVCPIPLFSHEPTRKCHTICPMPTWGSESDRKCKDNCLSNQYKESSNRVCTACESTCETCRGPTSDDCLSCSGERYLYGFKCLTDCSEGKYGKSSTHTCENCDPFSNCKTCETPDQPTKCLSCKVPYYLKSNKCVLSCSSSEFKDFINRKCEACHLSCATCYGGSLKNCLSCSGSLSYYEVDNTCISSCPSPYFATSNLCVKTCPVPLFGNSYKRICQSTCLSDEYADPSERICRKCHLDCLTCTGLTDTDCKSCQEPKYKNVSKCVLDCGPGYYGKRITNQNTCEACTNNCLVCVTPDGPSQCLGCGRILGVPYFLYGISCIEACPSPLWGRINSFTCEASCLSSDQYGDPVDRICKNCASHCLTCNHLGCLSCPSNLKLYQNDCVSCTGGFWGETSNKGEFRCINCLEKEEYLFTQKECTIKLPYYLDVKSGKCVSICPSKTYGNSFTKNCENCDPNCESCKTPNQPSCKSCESPLFLLNNKCVTEKECLPGNFVLFEPRQCLPCQGSCLECTGSPENCLVCEKPYFLLNMSCYKICPQPYFGNITLGKCLQSCNEIGEFGDLNGRICKPCDFKCKACQNYSSTCTSCNESLYLQNSSCIPLCPTKYFGSSDRKCMSCYPTCEYCLGSHINNCTSCLSGFFLTENKCSQTCPEGFYADEIEKKCKKCDISCLTCYGMSKAECLSCNKNNYLFGKSTCLNDSEIPTKFFIDQEKKQISSCNQALCLGCNFSPENCSSCHPGFFLNTDTNECNLMCDGMKCPNRTNGRCEACKRDSEKSAFEMTIENLISEKREFWIKTNKPFVLGKNLSLNDFFSLSFESKSALKPSYTIKNVTDREIVIKVISNTTKNLNLSLKIEKLDLLTDFESMKLMKIDSESINQSTIKYDKVYVIPYLIYVDEETREKIEELSFGTTVSLQTTFAISFLPIIIFKNFNFLWSLLDCAQTASFFLMINVVYPLNAQMFLEQLYASNLEYIPDFFKKMFKIEVRQSLGYSKDQIYPDQRAPFRFHQLNYSANLFENASFQIQFLIVSYFFIIAVRISSILARKKKVVINSIVALDKIFRYSFLINTHNIVYMKLVLAIMLQLTAYSERSVGLIMSYFLSVLLLIYLFWYKYWIFKNIVDPDFYLQEEVHISKFGCLASDLGEQNIFSKCHFVLMLLKKSLISLFLVWFQESPLLQISLFLSLEIATTLHYFFKKPFLVYSYNIILGINSILFVGLYIICICMHLIYERSLFKPDGTSDSQKEALFFNIGWVFSSFILICLLNLLIYHLFNIKQLYLSKKTMAKNLITALKNKIKRKGLALKQQEEKSSNLNPRSIEFEPIPEEKKLKFQQSEILSRKSERGVSNSENEFKPDCISDITPKTNKKNDGVKATTEKFTHVSANVVETKEIQLSSKISQKLPPKFIRERHGLADDTKYIWVRDFNPPSFIQENMDISPSKSSKISKRTPENDVNEKAVSHTLNDKTPSTSLLPKYIMDLHGLDENTKYHWVRKSFIQSKEKFVKSKESDK